MFISPESIQSETSFCFFDSLRQGRKRFHFPFATFSFFHVCEFKSFTVEKINYSPVPCNASYSPYKHWKILLHGQAHDKLVSVEITMQ